MTGRGLAGDDSSVMLGRRESRYSLLERSETAHVSRDRFIFALQVVKGYLMPGQCCAWLCRKSEVCELDRAPRSIQKQSLRKQSYVMSKL